jgi:hypothetical protein
MTQQQVADLIHTSKTNVWTIEKSAIENVQRAKETLYYFHTLNARHLCTLTAGSDLFDSAPLIFREARKIGIIMTIDSMDLINRLRTEIPKGVHGRFIKRDIRVFLGIDGTLEFG